MTVCLEREASHQGEWRVFAFEKGGDPSHYSLEIHAQNLFA
jgi:hypothetical protein